MGKVIFVRMLSISVALVTCVHNNLTTLSATFTKFNPWTPLMDYSDRIAYEVMAKVMYVSTLSVSVSVALVYTIT